MVPVDIFELVLHVEQPDAQSGGQYRDGELDQEERSETDRVVTGAQYRGQNQVGAQDAESLYPAGPSLPEAVLHHEEESRADYKQCHGVAVGPIAQSQRPRLGGVLCGGQGPDVARAASVEIAGRSVVAGVLILPVGIGGPYQQ